MPFELAESLKWDSNRVLVLPPAVKITVRNGWMSRVRFPAVHHYAELLLVLWIQRWEGGKRPEREGIVPR
jgi:hypothetical protein